MRQVIPTASGRIGWLFRAVGDALALLLSSCQISGCQPPGCRTEGYLSQTFQKQSTEKSSPLVPIFMKYPGLVIAAHRTNPDWQTRLTRLITVLSGRWINGTD